MKHLFGLLIVVLLAASLAFAGTVQAVGANVTYTVGECGETTFSAVNTTTVGNMYLVVEANGVVQYVQVPNNGTPYTITVGPFFNNPTVYWRMFGGAERDYDQPHWNGYGQAGFATNVNNYATSVGGWSWVLSGTGDANPFTTWNSFAVTGCPLTKDRCKDGGWQALGFENQGLCIKEVNEQLHN